MDRDTIEPRACIALRLEEIEALLAGLHCMANPPQELTRKLVLMKRRLIVNARDSVPALEGEYKAHAYTPDDVAKSVGVISGKLKSLRE